MSPSPYRANAAHERRRPKSTASWDDGVAADEIAALELGRLVEATEIGTGTVERLELTVDELAIAYPSQKLEQAV
jgi:hypothetical protein